MAENCRECGKRLPILPIKDLCSDCEFDSKSSAGMSLKQGTEMQRVHTITFHKDSEYADWLTRVGPNVEVLTTTTSKRGELDGSILNPWRHGVLRHRSLIVTWKYKQPQPTPVVQQSPPSSQQPKIDVAEQIEKLGRLRDQGLLTDEEFQMKKQELLSRL